MAILVLFAFATGCSALKIPAGSLPACSDQGEQQLLVSSAQVLARDTGGVAGPLDTSTCGGDLGGSVTIRYPGVSSAVRDARLDSLAYCSRWEATVTPSRRSFTPSPGSASSAREAIWWCSPRGTQFKVEPSFIPQGSPENLLVRYY